MGQIPLVTEEIAGGAKFLEEFGKKYPISAAVWLKKLDTRRWRLYVASADITDETRREAYGEISRIAGEMKKSFFDDSQIKLVMMTDRIAQDALKVHQWHSLPLATVYPVDSFGGMEVEAAYIYPPVETAAA